MFKLSVLDQSPVSFGSTHSEAIKNTVELAQYVEHLGYHRFWVSEHHDSERLSGSTPEVLIAHLGAKTSTIRIGSGGVMLPHYSAYKVAENFRMLEALYPNRIDLGLGRAPGGLPMATMALQDGKDNFIDRYPEQLDDLIGFLHDALDPKHRFTGLRASPIIETKPEIWLLGSSWESAKIAADKGTSFAFAQFINGQGGASYTKQYKQNFKPSSASPSAQSTVAIHVICAETEGEANRIASSMDLSLLLRDKGIRFEGIPSIEQAQQYSYSPYEFDRIRENRKRMIVGDPKQVKQQLIQLAKSYDTNEFIIVTITHEFKHKLKSYQLLADVFSYSS